MPQRRNTRLRGPRDACAQRWREVDETTATISPLSSRICRSWRRTLIGAEPLGEDGSSSSLTSAPTAPSPWTASGTAMPVSSNSTPARYDDDLARCVHAVDRLINSSEEPGIPRCRPRPRHNQLTANTAIGAASSATSTATLPFDLQPGDTMRSTALLRLLPSSIMPGYRRRMERCRGEGGGGRRSCSSASYPRSTRTP